MTGNSRNGQSQKTLKGEQELLYFIGSGQPIPVRELMNRFLATAGLPPVSRSVPPAVARAVGGALELPAAAARSGGPR